MDRNLRQVCPWRLLQHPTKLAVMVEAELEDVVEDILHSLDRDRDRDTLDTRRSVVHE